MYLIKREDCLKQIRPFIKTDIIKVLTGMRRCGKSAMLELIKAELLENGADETSFICYNFENMSFSKLCNAEALRKDIIKRCRKHKGKLHFFLDEIQEVDGWEKCINSIRVEFDSDIYITGSNSRLLSGELATYLAGRYVEFVVFPFSFKEFSLLNENKSLDRREAFKKYVKFGGMPYLWNLDFREQPVNQYLRDLFNAVEIKDIVRRNKIRDVDMLERMITYISSNIGMTFSATSIAKFMKSQARKIVPETILNYLKYCVDAFLFYKVKRNDLAGKQLLTTNEKYYLADHALATAVETNSNVDINSILENIVFVELKRRGYSVTVGKYDNKEIDFVCEKDNLKSYLQVCYILASDDTINREFGSLLSIKDNYPKYVLSLDEFDFSRNGIVHKNLIDWLLES